MGKPPLPGGPGSAETVVNTLTFQSLGVPLRKMGRHRIVRSMRWARFVRSAGPSHSSPGTIEIAGPSWARRVTRKRICPSASCGHLEAVDGAGHRMKPNISQGISGKSLISRRHTGP